MKEHIVFKRFQEEIEKYGLEIARIDDDGFIYIPKDSSEYKIHLENSIRDYESNGDFYTVDTIINGLINGQEEIPTWDKAKNHIYQSLVPNDCFKKADIFHQGFDQNLSKIFVYYKTELVHWITKWHVDKLKFNATEIINQSKINLNNELDQADIEIQDIHGHTLIFFDTDFYLKSELLLSTELKKKVEDIIGWPIYCVFPVRDFIYMFAETDYEFFAARLGHIVIDEYENTKSPITKGIYKISDMGFEMNGTY
ncbi:hypothetical protein [Flavobacterium sp. ASW18X]|uniref:hypothetical protein n=1 Tax=Flavobacterium sp. ASW18X TaxID=2572595 RepID=UPI0010ADB6A4|nr:hypothetical protein [Flavobacterium sp. ASW18X]TKD61817.1 hypothetical protein FBT53_10585 [Flavobacterium sp. ASW18X]